MSDHQIRLRGGWECWPAGLPGERTRLTLPTRWNPDHAGRFVLCRQFGRPAIDPHRATVLLAIAHAPGIESIELNDRALPWEGCDSAQFELPLGALPARNRLLLTIDLPTPRGLPDPDPAEWGLVSLIIREKESNTAD